MYADILDSYIFSICNSVNALNKNVSSLRQMQLPNLVKSKIDPLYNIDHPITVIEVMHARKPAITI